VERLGAVVVGCAFLVELAFLDGRRRLDGFDVHALVSYDAE
jgi:adenine phosphoribosyltransferase